MTCGLMDNREKEAILLQESIRSFTQVQCHTPLKNALHDKTLMSSYIQLPCVFVKTFLMHFQSPISSKEQLKKITMYFFQARQPILLTNHTSRLTDSNSNFQSTSPKLRAGQKSGKKLPYGTRLGPRKHYEILGL